MDVLITIKNYRCFQDANPVSFVLHSGFTSFVGVNNAGKSSLLKFFYELRPLFKLLSAPSEEFQNALHSSIPHYSVGYGMSVKDRDEIFCKLNDRNLELAIEFREHQPRNNTTELWNPTKAILNISRSDHSWWLILFTENEGVQFDSRNARAGQFRFVGTELAQKQWPNLELLAFFELFKCFAEMLYIGPFRNAINVGSTINYFDIQVGQAFIQAWRVYKTGASIKDNEAALNLTENIRQIFEFNKLEITPSNGDTDLKVFVDGRSYTLSELGAGLAQFIIVFTNAAVKQPSFILVDEPELSLHPKLQHEFLRALGIYASEGVLFATHSIGLARASSQLVYSVRKGRDETRTVTELAQLPSLAEFLGEIGFSAYRELGFDKLLLVEGPHDVTTIQEFLRIWGKEHEIVILPLGGGSLIKATSETQLLEITRITTNVSAIIDSERTNENEPLSSDRQGFKEACEKVGIPCHVLKRRALENYLSDSAIKKVKGTQYSALAPYEKLLPRTHGWGKSEDWKIAREMPKSDLENTDLGAFLDQL